MYMCRHLRRLHISTTFLPQMTDLITKHIADMIDVHSPNLAVLEWRHTETHRVGPISSGQFFLDTFVTIQSRFQHEQVKGMCLLPPLAIEVH